MHRLGLVSLVFLPVLASCMAGCIVKGVRTAQSTVPGPAPVVRGDRAGAQGLTLASRIRPDQPIRLGGVYTLGLGEKSDPLEESAAQGVALSADNQQWIAAHCDLMAFNAVNITRNTFPALMRAQRLFTPLLFLYASSLYEQPGQKGSVGGWQPKMAAWTLRDNQGREVPHPDRGAHWMDFGNPDWAAHWRDQALALARQYGAAGVVAAEMPLGNTFVGDSLAKYKTPSDRKQATGDWLQVVHKESPLLLIPSAVGFDEIVGHSTPPTPPGTEEAELVGRLWDEVRPLIDGAWVEGWVRPYWSNTSLPESLWEIQLEAADRAARNGQVFIAAAAYRTDAELEFALASYLLVSKRQGRVVFQPMPQLPKTRADAGYSLTILRQQVEAKAGYFNVPLGVAIQERHPFAVEGGSVWRRAFQYGVVYVNSDDQRARTVTLGGPMKRVDGSITQQVELPPHSGAILLYIETDKK